ncbi:MAG: DEAD/DEAH box helicase family protein, partial [Cellulosilyticaceae bacterium]
MYKEGLYEKVITKALSRYLAESDHLVIREPLEQGEADHVLSRHLTEVIQLALKQIEEDKRIKEEDKLTRQVGLVNQVIEQLSVSRGEAFEEEQVEDEAEMLYGIDRPDQTLRPMTPLSQTMLFTNAKNEPNLFGELRLEMLSCERVDLLVSFIKWSGLRCLKEALETFTKDHQLRVITTSYMGASDYHAIEFLASLPNTEVKISYDTKRTKHHAKAYMFHRDTGFSTAYIGSSNLSQSALVSGLEWNVKVTEKDSKDVIDKFGATFEAYWNDDEFVSFTKAHGDRLKQALNNERYKGREGYQIESAILPNYFQKEILERLRVEREVYGFYKNLVVAATGVGKTVISALDYKRFRRNNREGKGRLLFVAHKQEILKQSLAIFRRVLMDWNFGELYYSGHIPDNKDYLFVTIQTFNSQKFY